MNGPEIERLIQLLGRLPGLGPRSARRAALHLLAESEAILTEYLERGGNFIDTANLYTNGHSEKIIGDFFAQRKARRDRNVIATNVPFLRTKLACSFSGSEKRFRN